MLYPCKWFRAGGEVGPPDLRRLTKAACEQVLCEQEFLRVSCPRKRFKFQVAVTRQLLPRLSLTMWLRPFAVGFVSSSLKSVVMFSLVLLRVVVRSCVLPLLLSLSKFCVAGAMRCAQVGVCISFMFYLVCLVVFVRLTLFLIICVVLCCGPPPLVSIVCRRRPPF